VKVAEDKKIESTQGEYYFSVLNTPSDNCHVQYVGPVFTKKEDAMKCVQLLNGHTADKITWGASLQIIESANCHHTVYDSYEVWRQRPKY
jgi:hypothetical protein